MPTVDLTGQPAWTVVVVVLLLVGGYLASLKLKRIEHQEPPATPAPAPPPGPANVFEHAAIQIATQAIADARAEAERARNELADVERRLLSTERDRDDCYARERRSRGATP